MKLALVFVFWIGIVVSFSGCGGEGKSAGSLGHFGGPCRTDGSCDEGLTCVDHVCKSK